MLENLLTSGGVRPPWEYMGYYNGPEKPMHVLHGDQVTFLPPNWTLGSTIKITTLDLQTLEQTSRTLGPMEMSANSSRTTFTSHNGILYFYQGTNASAYVGEIWSFNPETDIFDHIVTTRNSANCPIVRTDTHFVAGNGLSSASKSLDNYLVIDVETLAMTTISKGSVERSISTTLVEKDGLVYGLHGDLSIGVEIDPFNKTLIDLKPDIITPRIRKVQGGILKNKFFSFASSGTIVSNRCFGYYDFETNSHQYINLEYQKNQPYASSSATCFVYKDRLWIIPDSSTSKHQIWAYTP